MTSIYVSLKGSNTHIKHLPLLHSEGEHNSGSETDEAIDTKDVKFNQLNVPDGEDTSEGSETQGQ